MVHRRGSRKRLTGPLLVVLMLSASHHDAAAPSPGQSAYRAGRAALDRGETVRAVQIVEAALAAAGTRRDADYHALRILRAELYVRQGDRAKALALFEEPLPPQAAMSEAAVYRNVILARIRQDKTLFRAAREIAAKHPKLVPVVTMYEIGYGMHDDDLDAVTRKAVAQARAFGDGSVEARLKATRGYVLVRQMRFAEAIAALEEAEVLSQKLKLRPNLAATHGNMGWAYWELGDLENAADLFARAEAATRELGLVEEQVPWLLQLGNVAYERRDYATAAKHYTEILRLAPRITTRMAEVASAAHNSALVALRHGRVEEARRFHEQSLTIKKTLPDNADSLARADIFHADLLAYDQRVDEAKKILDRVANQSKNKSIQWEARGSLARLYLKVKREDLAEPQFRLAIETIRDARDDIREPELRLSFSSRATEILDPYLDFLVSQGRTLDALAAVDAYHAQTLEEELEVVRPRNFDPRATAKRANATILSYWLGEKRSYLWVITADRLSLHTLPTDTTINTAAEAYQRELLGRRGTLAQSGARGQALYRMLVEPAGAIARESRVVVVPDGQLHRINFETLVAPSPKPHYWIEDVIVTTAASLQLLAEAPKPGSAAPKMLLIGDPPQADPAFPKLPHAAREINAIAQQFARPVVLRGPQATPSSYAEAKPEAFDYLHFVAHGVAMRQKPLDSAVILGRDKSSRYRLSAREIVDRPLRAKLVTISSCYGAGLRAYGGEGLVGLAWAFLSAGADQVIAALWEVNDAATADLMQQMYAGIREGRDPAVALRAAKLRMVRSGTIHAKPTYWAPFVLYTGR